MRIRQNSLAKKRGIIYSLLVCAVLTPCRQVGGDVHLSQILEQLL